MIKKEKAPIINTIKIAIASFLLIGFFGFAIFGGAYNWLGFIFALLLLPLGVLDEMIEDYSKLLRRR